MAIENYKLPTLRGFRFAAAKVTGIDDDGNGIINVYEDKDDDGIFNRYDDDIDGDGIRNALDNDYDGDGKKDIDRDFDGLPDNVDANPDNRKSNNNRFSSLKDRDGDGYLDNDRNRDGYYDDDLDHDGYSDNERNYDDYSDDDSRYNEIKGIIRDINNNEIILTNDIIINITNAYFEHNNKPVIGSYIKAKGNLLNNILYAYKIELEN